MQPLPPGEFTHAYLDALPEDGQRYELVDGMLAITRAHGAIHQRAVLQLCTRLAKACPSDLEVLTALAFRPAAQRSLLPDVLVCHLEDGSRESAERPLPMIVEVVSPATRTLELTLKREIYAEAGVLSYWIFDPEEELLTVLELVDGHYAERTLIKGNDAFDAELPFPVRIIPADQARPINRSAL